jgi:hypothetical protein
VSCRVHVQRGRAGRRVESPETFGMLRVDSVKYLALTHLRRFGMSRSGS